MRSPCRKASSGRPSGPTDIEEKIMKRIPREIVAVAAVLGILGAAVFDALTGLFVLAGGALAALGFAWLKRSLERVLLRGKPQALRAGILLYAARLGLIIALFFLIILFYPRKLLAFAVGFSTMIPVFLGEVAIALARTKQWKD
jgi:hypothetical protein